MGRSKEFFWLGFADVFKASGVPEPVLLRVGELLYVDARCGFFHDGVFRERVYFAEITMRIWGQADLGSNQDKLLKTP